VESLLLIFSVVCVLFVFDMCIVSDSDYPFDIFKLFLPVSMGQTWKGFIAIWETVRDVSRRIFAAMIST
jgi:hypothetical protein